MGDISLGLRVAAKWQRASERMAAKEALKAKTPAKRFKQMQLLERAVTHMIVTEFGDRGTWGGNTTELIYLLATLPKRDQKEFIALFLQKFEKRLTELLMKSDGMPLGKKDFKKAKEAFARFNPTFVGGFHLGEEYR